MKLYCCECKQDTNAILTDGKEIYSHREDLYNLPFWKCPTCNNYVGCHHKTKDRTKPLGVIPNQEIRNIRSKIHSILDPIWKSKKMTRKELYKKISNKIDKQFHTANIQSIEEGQNILDIIRGME